MTFRELLDKYRAGQASEEERALVEAELEKSEAIADYLAEQVEDALGAAELAVCRGVLEKMPFADRACGFFCDRAALAAWPAFDALQLRLDTLPVYGSLEELLPPMGKETLDEAVRAAASALYHAACHTALFDAQPEAALPALQKAAFFALRLAHCRRSGQYTAARQALLPKLEPEERALLGKDCTLPALMAWARGEMES